MAFELSRVDRLEKTYDLAARFPNLDGPFTAADVALLPPRVGPNAATVWYTVTVASGIATVLFAGPDADSTGAVVVTGSADLWLKAGTGSEVDAVKVERITLLGSGTVIAPGPLPQVLSVQGRTGAVSLSAADVGAATPTDLSDGLATKVNSSTYTAGLAGKQDKATLGADVAADATVRAAFERVAPPPSGGDDRPALQALLDQGVTLRLQAGTYLLASKGSNPAYAKGCLRIPANSKLIGQGMGRTIIKAADTLPMDTPLLYSLTATDVEIAHFTIDGNKARIPAGSRGGVEDEGVAIKGAATRLSIHHLHIHDTGQDCIDFDHTQGSVGSDISYCLLENAGGFGIHNSCPNLLIFKTTIRNNGFDRLALGVTPNGGIDMVWSDITMRDCQVYGNAKYQVVIEGGGNTADNLLGETPNYQPSFRQRIANSVIDASGVPGSNAIYLLRTASQVLITDSTIMGPADAVTITGISGATASQELTIDNCDVISAGTATNMHAVQVPGDRMRVARSRIKGGNRGVELSGANCRVADSDFTGQAGRALVCAAPAAGARIVGNTFDATPSSESITLNTAAGHLVEGNAIGKGMSGFTGNTVRRNTGVVTEAFGAAVIPDTAQTVTITHGLRAAPTAVLVGTDAATPVALSVTSIGATTFSIRRAGTTGAQNVWWDARV